MAEMTGTHHHDGIASSSTVSGSALASTPYVHYDIFVMHYEDETRDFAMELSKRLVSRGLYVFLSRSEQEVTSSMEAAISLASLQIAIFSPKYATCKWSMDMLVRMIKSEAPILPVFYGVEPFHLRYTGKDGKGPYAPSLRADEEEARYDSQTMQAWRNALERVSNLKGFVLNGGNGGEEELLRQIEESVFKTWCRRAYHVFICHHEKDTREEFAEALYRRLDGLQGLRVFLEKTELVEAYQIEPQIEVAIQSASVNIVIFSPRFPESPWCLNELSLMTMYKANILPVFYGVRPSDLLGNQYMETLLSHLEKGRQDRKTINRWRDALDQVPKSDDLMLTGDKEELMNKIVRSVLKNIPESELIVQNAAVERAVESVLNEDGSKRSVLFELNQIKQDMTAITNTQMQQNARIERIEQQLLSLQFVETPGSTAKDPAPVYSLDG